MLARYVPGADDNETALAYDASSTKNWHHEDAQGSVITASDGSGNAAVTNQYGPYGKPGIVYQGRNTGRIRYTGQAMITEAGTTTGINQILYDYRARIYAPKLGKFLRNRRKRNGPPVYPAVYTESACLGDRLCMHVNNKFTQKPRLTAVAPLLVLSPAHL